jgi:uncharacterized membrane protein
LRNGTSGDPDETGPNIMSGVTHQSQVQGRVAEDIAGLQAGEEEAAVVVTATPAASQPIMAEASRSALAADDEAAKVHVAPNLLDLISAPSLTVEEKREIEHTRDLNDVIHRVLVIGLFASTAAMLAGMVLAVVRHRALATTAPEIAGVWARVEALRPSGFLALGILILIATPIFRVLGSFVIFSYERDWRYAGITLIVLLVLIASLLIGRV